MIYALFVGVLAFIVSLTAGGPLVKYLRLRRIGKAISDEGPASHSVKAGTPTMGGLLIFGTVFVVTVPTNLFTRASIALPLATIVAMGIIGFIDDLLTLEGRDKMAAHATKWWLTKLGLIFALATAAACILYWLLDVHSINIPWVGKYSLGLFYLPVAVLTIVGTTSAVAVSDGLDGLAGGLAALAFAAYGLIAFLQEQLFLATFSYTVVGATMGFLWYNAYPARIFMGDTGALALGATLAVVALMTGHWLLLPIIGIVFVAEALSDVIQIAYYKLSGGKRVFKMAPLHHHFELLGWPETHVVLRLWLVGVGAAMGGIALALAVE